MEGSATTGGTAATQMSIQIEMMKRAQNVQAQQVLSLLDSSSAQNSQAAAQLTGVGVNLDIRA